MLQRHKCHMLTPMIVAMYMMTHESLHVFNTQARMAPTAECGCETGQTSCLFPRHRSGSSRHDFIAFPAASKVVRLYLSGGKRDWRHARANAALVARRALCDGARFDRAFASAVPVSEPTVKLIA